MKKKKWIPLCILALIGCVVSGVYIVYYINNQRMAERVYEEAREKESEPEATETPVPTEKTETPTAQPTEKPVDIPVDFAALKEQNDEIYAWIRVPGTAVDYPVVQSRTDDSFYIHRGINKENLYAGAIYTEMANARDFSDPNTVLYGHNMKDGSMLASLHNFRDRDFFDSNREILIYTPEHILHYTIFAAYTYDNRHLLNSFDFHDPQVFQEYLDQVYDVRSMDAYFADQPKVTAKDKIITLSTCIGSSSSRYLVQGVLTETE